MTATARPFVPETDIAEAQAANARLARMQRPDVTTPDGLARMRATSTRPHAAPPVLTPRDMMIDGPAGPIRARSFRPEQPAQAVFFNVHGGGWSIGNPEQDDMFNDFLARQCEIATVSIDYRLAPEHRHPAALDDCNAALHWLVEHGPAEFGTGRLVIGGSSAGGHLAAQALLHARDVLGAIDRVVAVNLLFGCFDVSGTPSQRLATSETLVLNSDWLAQFSANAFGPDGEHRRHASVSPLYADLRGLPPALFTVGALDPLLDDSLFMAARWNAAGGRADIDIWPEAGHGFVSAMPNTGNAVRARMRDWLNDRLAA